MPMKGGGGGGGKDVRAGGAFVEIFGRDNLTKLLGKMQARVAQFGKFLSSAGSAALKAGGALALPVTVLLGQGVNRAAEVDKLSEAFGMSAEQMSKLAYAAEVAGVSIEEVVANQSKFQKLIDGAPVIDAATAKAATTAQQEFRGALIAVQNALVPLLKTITPVITAVGAFARQNATVVQIVGAVAAGLIAFGIAAKLGAVAVFGLAGAFAVVAKLIALAVSPIGLVTIAVAGLGYLFIRYTETGKAFGQTLGRVFSDLRNYATAAFRDLGNVFGTTFGGIMDALRGGDMALAGQIAFKGLETAWARTEMVLTDAWIGLKDVFVDGWHQAIAAVITEFNSLRNLLVQEMPDWALISVGAIGGAFERYAEFNDKYLELIRRSAVEYEMAYTKALNAVFSRDNDISEGIVARHVDMIARLLNAARGLAEHLGLEEQFDGALAFIDQVNTDAKVVAADARKNIAEDTANRNKAIQDELNAKLAANRAFRDQQKADAAAAFQSEMGELEALRNLAKSKYSADDPDERRGLLPSFVIPKKEDLFKEARGGFASSASAGQFGFGDKGDGILGELKALNKLAANWIGATANLNIIAENSKKFGIVVGN